MTLARRIRLILDGDTSAMFARGGGGAKSSKGGKGSRSKKAKGATQAGSGGACCKAEGGKFAPGNNYGSLGGKASSQKAAATRVKQRLEAKSKVARAEAASKAAAGPAKAGIAGMVGRSTQASAKAAQVKAARDKAALEKKQAKNAKVREKRAAKKEAAKPKAVERGTPERKAQVDAAKRDRDWNRRNRAGAAMKEAEAARALDGQAKAARGRAIGGLEIKDFGYSRGKYRLSVNGEEVRPGGMLLSFDKKRDALAFQEKLNAVGNWKNMDKFTDAQKKQVGAIAKDIEANKSMASLMKRGDPEAAAGKGLVELENRRRAETAQESAEAAKVRAAEQAEDQRLSAIIRAKSKARAATEARPASLKRLTDKSRVASGKAGAKNAMQKRDKEFDALIAKQDARKAAEAPERAAAIEAAKAERAKERRDKARRIAEAPPSTPSQRQAIPSVHRAAAMKSPGAASAAAKPVTPVKPPPASVRSVADAVRAAKGTQRERIEKLLAKSEPRTARLYKEYRALETRRDELTAKIRALPSSNQKTFSRLMRERDEIDRKIGGPGDSLANQYRRVDRLRRATS